MKLETQHGLIISIVVIINNPHLIPRFAFTITSLQVQLQSVILLLQRTYEAWVRWKITIRYVFPNYFPI